MSTTTEPVIKDISDIHKHYGRKGLIDRAEVSCHDYQSVPESQVVESEPIKNDIVAIDTNDADRARAFVDHFEHCIRYLPTRRSWMTFERGRWRLDVNGAVQRLAIRFAIDRIAMASNPPADDEKAWKVIGKRVNDATKLGNRKLMNDYLALAAFDSRIILDESVLDADPWVVGAENAVIELKTGTIRDYCPTDFITRTLGTNADPDAACPRWEQFIAETLPDCHVARYIQKAAGYSLTGLTQEHMINFLYGTGSNGKSTFIEVLQAVFGSYAKRVAKAILEKSRNGDYPKNAIAALSNARLYLGSEAQEGGRLNEDVLKDLSGGDTVTGERKYQDEFDFRPVGKIWIFGNHRPVVKGTDDGIWRRMRLIEFGVKFDESQKDPDLPGKLAEELPGILQWLVRGCLLWQVEGLPQPEAVVAATRQYRSDEDTLGEFIADRTEEGSECRIPHPVLYDLYRNWCSESGVRYPMTTKALSKSLRERGWQDTSIGDYKVVWLGRRTITPVTEMTQMALNP